jgi:hypothetical protein
MSHCIHHAQFGLPLLICRFAGYEKNVVILSKKTDESPYTSFMGKGVIDLPPQTVFDAIRNPQLRFTYDNMLKVREGGGEREETTV